jgi:hypothetical protein
MGFMVTSCWYATEGGRSETEKREPKPLASKAHRPKNRVPSFFI